MRFITLNDKHTHTPPLPDNTQHSQERDSHAPVWIQTRRPTKLAAAEHCLRLRGRRDRPIQFFGYETKRNFCNTDSAVGQPTKPLATIVGLLIPS